MTFRTSATPYPLAKRAEEILLSISQFSVYILNQTGQFSKASKMTSAIPIENGKCGDKRDCGSVAMDPQCSTTNLLKHCCITVYLILRNSE